MNYITKFAVFAALLAFVSAAAVRKGPAPDVLDEVVRDSTFVDLFGVPPDVQHCKLASFLSCPLLGSLQT